MTQLWDAQLHRARDDRLHGSAPDGAGDREADRRRPWRVRGSTSAMAIATGCGRRAPAMKFWNRLPRLPEPSGRELGADFTGKGLGAANSQGILSPEICKIGVLATGNARRTIPTTNSCPTRAAAISNLRDHAVRQRNRRGRHCLRCCDGQGKPRMRRGRIPFLCAQKNSPGLHNDRGLQVTRQSENGRALGYPVGSKYMGRDKAEGYVIYPWQTATPRVKYSDHSSGLAPMSGWCSPGWGSHHPPAGAT
jgi:hypothetical protein